MVIALTPVDIFQRNLFYYKIPIVVLTMNLWALWVSCGKSFLLFFVSLWSAEIPWVSGLLLVLVLPFSGPF